MTCDRTTNWRHAIHARLLLTLLLGSILFSERGGAQGRDLIVNGSFEDPQLSACNFDNVNFLTGWSRFLSSPDVVWNGCSQYETFTDSPHGRQWIFLFSDDSDNDHEAIRQQLASPMIPGRTYDFSFLGITKNPILKGRGHVYVYLSENPFQTSTYSSQTLLWGTGDERNGKLRGKAKVWHRYEKKFVADKAYRFIMIKAEREPHSAIDDVRLLEYDNTCPGNIVQNWDFENQIPASFPVGWTEVNIDYGSWYCTNNLPCSDPDIVDAALSGSSWLTLRAHDDFPQKDVNAGIESLLATPMVSGQWYWLSVGASTKSPNLWSQGSLRWYADTAPMDWDDGDLTGTVVWNDRLIDGTEKQWNYYSNNFLAGQAYTYLALQARKGWHVAIDDICVTPFPHLPGSIRFSSATYNAQEMSGIATITLERVAGTRGQVTVDFLTVPGGGTATNNIDYTQTTQTVTFPAGSTTQTLTVPIIDDMAIEGDETITLAIQNPTGGASLGTITTAILTIADDPGGVARKEENASAPKTTTATAEEMLRRGKIVWVSDRTGTGALAPNNSLFWKAVRSAQPPKIVPGTTDGRHPAWSENGRFIAYIQPVTRLVGSTTVTEDHLRIVDQDGKILASFFAPTIVGTDRLGYPEWSKDGSKIVFSYYNVWPSAGVATIEFAQPYQFGTYMTTIRIPNGPSTTALDPVFSPAADRIYFHGVMNAPYGDSSNINVLNLSNGTMSTIDAHGAPTDRAFHPSVSPDGSRIIYNSERWKDDPYQIFDEEEIMQIDLTSGTETKISDESGNDYGTFAKGGHASGEYVRQNNPDATGHTQLYLQKQNTIVTFDIADLDNVFGDHAASWVIPKINVWDIDVSVVSSNVQLTFDFMRVSPVDGGVIWIERSTDASSWTTIGQLMEPEELYVETPMSFTDATALGLGVQTVYYRLSIADPDNGEAYSYSDVAYVILSPVPILE